MAPAQVVFNLSKETPQTKSSPAHAGEWHERGLRLAAMKGWGSYRWPILNLKTGSSGDTPGNTSA